MGLRCVVACAWLAVAALAVLPVDAAETRAVDASRAAQLKRLACVTAPEVVEVEIRSDDVFPVRNALIELHVGPVISSLSRYADDGDLHTIIFLLTRDELASVAPADIATVRFNPGSDFDTWLVGAIDARAAVGCDVQATGCPKNR
jgi:hypothetical protein